MNYVDSDIVLRIEGFDISMQDLFVNDEDEICYDLIDELYDE